MPTTSLLERFAGFDTAAVSDALERVGLPPGVPGLTPLTTATTVLGFARTALLEPHDGSPSGAHILTGVVDAAGPDDVIVVDNGGRTDVSCWGGILGLGASARQVRGVLLDGVCRDVDENRERGLPVYGRGSTPLTARGRLQQRTTGEPVTIAGRTVREGDIVLHDATGFVVVPRDRAGEVADEAERIVGRENAIAQEVRAGSLLHEAMRDARLAGTEETQS